MSIVKFMINILSAIDSHAITNGMVITVIMSRTVTTKSHALEYSSAW